MEIKEKELIKRMEKLAEKKATDLDAYNTSLSADQRYTIAETWAMTKIMFRRTCGKERGSHEERKPR